MEKMIMSVEHQFYIGVGYVLTHKAIQKAMKDEETEIDVLADLVATEAGCKYWQFGNFVVGPDCWIMFGPDLRSKGGMEDGNISCGGHLSFDEVRGCVEVMKRIGKKLRKLGLKVGEPKVALCYEIY